MIAALAFYVFAAILLVSAGMVVSARNPVHSVLFLILAFFNAAALFLLAGAEFLAMTLVIVYVGAVAVLFLFVVMMLDVDFAELRGGFQRYLPVGLTVGAVLLLELALVLSGWKFLPEAAALRFAPDAGAAGVGVGALGNTAQLGNLIYTDYVFLFQAAGLVLLVAMIGAIVLTLHDRGDSRRQVIARQIARDPKHTMVMMNLASHTGTRDLAYLRPTETEPVETGDLPESDHHETAHSGGHR